MYIHDVNRVKMMEKYFCIFFCFVFENTYCSVVYHIHTALVHNKIIQLITKEKDICYVHIHVYIIQIHTIQHSNSISY